MACILDESSLAGTLRNLEAARVAGARRDDPDAAAALDWVLGRRADACPDVGCFVAGKREHAPRFFAATESDFREMLPTPTREHAYRACTLNILGMEAARALWLWGRIGTWPADEVFAEIRDKGRSWPPSRVGYTCCEGCSVSRWRAVMAAQPAGWETVVAAGLRELAGRPLQGAPGWRKFPFYYTLLALSEFPMEEAVEAERRRVRPAAESLLREFRGDDAAARFRRRALEWAVAGPN